MRRRLIMGERIMYVDASTPLNCVFAVTIRGSFTLERLRNALHRVQQKHPLLRASIKEDAAGVPYFVSSNKLSEIPVRIGERVSDDDWKIQSKAEWRKLFDGKSAPLARVVWLKDAEVSDLILVCPHCICDGTTFIALMSEILEVLDKPEKELSSYLPFNSMEGLLSQSFKASKGKILKAKFFSVVARLFFLFKSTKSKKPEGQNYFVHWRLDAEKTAALTIECKTAGASVYAALCVILLKAFQSVKGNKAQGKIICPVDVRRFVTEIKEDTMFAFAPIAELSVDDKLAGFWEKAKKVKEDLNAKIAAMNVHELLIMSEYFHGSVKKMVKYLLTTEGSHDVTFSNMGRLGIPENYDSFEVEAIYSPTVGFPWRNPNTIVVSTFKGEMDFSFCSNDAFLPESEAIAIKNKALELLLQELMISYA
nr:condensation domain-containing protein [uncultured Pedobacter sp.]